MMQKYQLSTCSENSGTAGNTSNEAQLMQLIKNLQLELGYHVMALKKAQKMIQLLQKDNKSLKTQNQELKTRCKDLQLKVIKYDNQLSSMSQCSSSQYIQCFSAGLKNKNTISKSPYKSSLQNLIKQGVSPIKRTHKELIDPETVLKQKNNRITKSTKLYLDPYETQFQQNEGKSSSPRRKMKKNNQRNSTNLENGLQFIDGTKSLSFIPFEQLQFKTKYN